MTQQKSKWKHHSYANGSEGVNPDNTPIYQGAELLINTTTQQIADSWYASQQALTK